MKNKIVVYTALFGNYSGIIEQPKIKGVEYLCYTDQDITSKSWKIIKVTPPVPNDNTRSNRYYKILPHKHLKGYDISVYIDANYLIIGDFVSMVLEKLTKNSMVCFDHNQTVFDPKDCIYKEHQTLINLAKEKRVFRDSIEVMQNQIDFFKSENYPENNGLIFAAVLIRKHFNEEVINLMELWWSFVKNKSRRDQLSFNYAVWKLNFDKLEYLKGDLRRGNPWFYWIDHKLNFKKDIQTIKRQLFLEKNPTLRCLLFYTKLPLILNKLNKWCKRYSFEPLSTSEINNIRKSIINNKLDKTQIIKEIEYIDSIKKEERLSYWNHYLENVLPKKQGSPVLKIAKESNLTAVIVEARKHPHFKVVVENMLLNTQHLNVCLHVYHGTENEKFVKDCLKEHENIKFINLNIENIDIEGYNKIMLSEDFYKNINSELILVFQTDVITFKPLDTAFLQYDYIGAPWKKKEHLNYKAEVGNGGLSIRSKKAMLTILEQKIPRETFVPEDLYLAQILKQQNFNIPSYETALEFATEGVYNPNAFGCHKSWEVIKTSELKELLK
ncbi:hypothetical protein AXE80_11275 [Wenyingzhuangia fucanilytica]|uniref:Uncharacterized protein n=1 Tax=Wenyingzhuangia fucanilytica TaxID=1790137 RepID=A0A1B1Y7S5_9FLAO|nr:DUF5672 family protein [Wenyingzhuangia fucanilytica]ANW96825.1 hypothetical protein AXE80_11275 [Wenyingzhuangia fucanilytica]